MPANLPRQKAALQLAKSKDKTATGFVDALEDYYDLISGDSNEFGSSATVDTGTELDDIPLLEAGGRLNAARLPLQATIQTWLTQIPSTAEGNEITSARLARYAPLWAVVPSAHLWGSGTAITGGTAITSSWLDFPLVRQDNATRPWAIEFHDVRHFRAFRIRYQKPG